MGLFKIIGIVLLLCLVIGALLVFGVVKLDGDFVRINFKNKANSSVVEKVVEVCNETEVCLVNVSNVSLGS